MKKLCNRCHELLDRSLFSNNAKNPDGKEYMCKECHKLYKQGKIRPEEKKLHLACGTVYLNDWINIDLPIKGHYLAKNRPDLVEINGTTIDNYYKTNVTKKQFIDGTFQKKEVVCDRYSDIRRLPYEDGTIDQILAVHVFEHFTFAEGKELLKEWLRVLKPGGYLRIHVPDVAGIIELCAGDADTDWAIRQLYGSQKNDYAMHKAGYTFESLDKVLTEAGFEHTLQVKSINDYPAFGISAFKPVL